MTPQKALVVQLTPPGRGAVATLRVEGPDAVETVQRRFRARSGRRLHRSSDDQLLVGRFGSGLVGRFGSGAGEEVVVRRRGRQSVEIHCHGGHAAAATIEKVLVALGCQAVPWQQWAADHHEDPITAAAHAALAEARTLRTAAILLDQYLGALRRAMEEIEAALRNHDLAGARQQVAALLARAEVGRHLVQPWRVVLAGRANVGKSSLINALVGYARAIVHDAPGTTRDVVSARAALDGWPVELSDTAGICGGRDTLEQAAAELAQEKLRRAELVVLVFDAGAAWSESDQALLEAWPGGLVVDNKSDLLPGAGLHKSARRRLDPGASPLATSATTGEGIEALVLAIADRLVPNPPPPGAAVPFTAEQIEHLERLDWQQYKGLFSVRRE